MPRKRIPRAVFNQPPQYGHRMTVKNWSYWFLGSNVLRAKNGKEAMALHWITLCSRCRLPFTDQSELSVFWLHKRCPKHRRKQPPLDEQLSSAIRIFEKLKIYG